MFRETTRDVQLHGRTIPAGKFVLVMVGSANRDPARFSNANDFDITRDPNPHIAFGHGIHFCLGAALARLESRVALEELLPVLGEYVIDRSGAERVHSGNVRGFRRLPLEPRPGPR